MAVYIAYLALPICLILMQSGAGPDIRCILEAAFAVIAAYWLMVISQRFRRPLWRFLTAFIPACFIFFFQFLELISYFLQGESFNERFFFHVRLSSLTVGAPAYEWMALTPLVSTLVAGVLDALLSKRSGVYRTSASNFSAWILAILAFILLPNAPKNFAVEYFHVTHSGVRADFDTIKDELKRQGVNTEAFSPQRIEATGSHSSKNLVLIYLESLESSYLDEGRFPGLVPNIKRAMKNGLAFTNISEYQGTSWTMGGIFSSQCGMPLAVMGNDSIYENRTLRNIVGLGDVLKSAGYYQVYMGGADLSFAGKGNFYRNHGYQEVLGYKNLISAVKDPTYKTGWGLYDDTLFDLAARQFKNLSEQHEKFNLTLLTLDTHHPTGDASRSCPSYPSSGNSMLQAVHCTDFLFGKFLSTLQRDPHYDKTLIFAMADHLAMKNVAMPLYPEAPRKLIAFALNAGSVGKIDTAGAHFDIAPTILDLLQIQTNAIFPLGQSLLKPERPDRFAIFRNNGYELLKGFLEAVDRATQPVNICDGQGITAAEAPKHALSIGGRSITMSSKGWPDYPTDRIFIVKGTLSGEVQEYRIVTEAEAVKMIEASPQSLYFMLTQKANIPFGLYPNMPRNQWNWYMGNPSSMNIATGSTPQFEEVTLSAEQCRDILAGSRESLPQIFSMRKQIQHLGDSLKAMTQQEASAHAHFFPASITAVSSSVDGAESYIALDDMELIATKGITLVVIDPSNDRIIHDHSYDVTGDSSEANALTHALQGLRTNDIFFVVTHGGISFPAGVAKTLEDLGATEIKTLGVGQPYILMARAGTGAVAEKTGEHEATISQNYSAYEGEDSINAVRRLWGGHTIIIQSASLGKGISYVRIDDSKPAQGGRGLNVVILNAATRAVKSSARFDTYADAEATDKLCIMLGELKANDIVIVFADDSASGGPIGARLPDSLQSILKQLGARNTDMIGFRTPYIFLTRVGSDFRIEKYSESEGVIRTELTPLEFSKLFPNDN